MSTPGPFDADDPFGGMAAMFGELMRSMGGAGGPDWEAARQLAASIANAGEPEHNVDPSVRMSIEQLGRVAEMHVEELTGLTVGAGHRGVEIAPVTRSQWTAAAIEAYRPLFERLAGSLGAMLRTQLDELEPGEFEEIAAALPPGLPIDPAALVAGLRQFIGPMMLSSMAGSTVGQLGSRVFGTYDLPIPRPGSDVVQLVVANIDAFGTDWSLPADDLRLWMCLHEVAHHAVLSIPHVAERIGSLLAAHAGAFTADPSVIEQQLGTIDLGDPASLERLGDMMADPDVVLGAMRSDEQRLLIPQLDAVVVTVEGYVDWVLDTIGSRLLGSASMVTEAVRRRRVEADQASRFVERLFGLELTQDKLDGGSAFIDGVIERAGTDALATLWSDAEHLPTPAEIAAPGLWLARVGIEIADQELPDVEGFEIPDFPDLDS